MGGMGWEVGGGFRKEGTYVYLGLIHVAVWQTPTQYCKEIILQFKINFKRKRKQMWILRHWLECNLISQNVLYHVWNNQISRFLKKLLTVRSCPRSLMTQQKPNRAMQPKDSFQKEMATHSSIPAWRNLMHRGAWWAIKSIGSHRVGHDWSDLAQHIRNTHGWTKGIQIFGAPGRSIF